MRAYTPINEFKIKSKETKEFLKKLKKILNVKLINIYVSHQVFNDLLESMSPTRRELYSDGIPFEGKLLVRK